MSLRTVLTAAMSILAVLAILAAGSLIILTSYLHRSASELRAGIESVHFVEEAQVDLLVHSRAADPVVRAGIESVHFVEEAQVDLLVHSRAADPVVRAEIEQRIRRRITDARRYVTSDHEGEIVARVEQRLNTYLADGRTTEAPWEPRSDA